MNIKQSFNVYYENRVVGIYVRVMYAQMDNGRYYKVYKKNDEITPELITLECTCNPKCICNCNFKIHL